MSLRCFVQVHDVLVAKHLREQNSFTMTDNWTAQVDLLETYKTLQVLSPSNGFAHVLISDLQIGVRVRVFRTEHALF